MSLRDKLYRRFYPAPRPENPFDIRYRTLSKSAQRILDIGAGRGAMASRVAPTETGVIGSDLDRAIASNQALDHIVLSRGEHLAFDTGTFDLCVMRWVVEHLPEPERTFREVRRVLKPGGRLLILTSNMLFYAYAIAKLLPNRWHPTLVRWTSGRDERDVFPTLYRATLPLGSDNACVEQVSQNYEWRDSRTGQAISVSHYRAYCSAQPTTDS